MKKTAAVLTLMLLSLPGFAAETGYPLDHAAVDLSDKASLQRGAKYFVNYCMGCHGLSYLRYSRLARDLGLTEDSVEENLIFTRDKTGAPTKVGSLMTIPMTKPSAENAFGVAPPDLTLETRTRPHGSDWVYTYLRSFYLDESKQWGVNNAVFPNVAMPDVLWRLQGWQRPVFKDVMGENDQTHKVLVSLDRVSEGALTPEEFDQVALDITNFLTYAAEPARLIRYRTGGWVLFFLVILAVVTYFLKKEYWRDVK